MSDPLTDFAVAVTTPDDTNAPEPVLFGFPNPRDVRADKERLNPYVLDLDQAARGRAVPAAILSAYLAWRPSWSAFYAAKDSVVTAPASASRARAFEAQIADWQRRIGDYAELGLGPVGEASGAPSSGNAIVDAASAAAKETLSTLKTVALVGGAIVVALVGFAAYNAYGVSRGAAETLARVKAVR